MADVNHLIEIIGATAEAMGKVMTPAGLALLADDLREFPDSDVETALRRLRKEAGKISLFEIIQRLPNSWPSADEAFASFPKTESETAVVTSEASSAWGIVRDLWEANDRVAARMAFREAYNAAVSTSREISATPQWFPSIGTAVDGREAPLRKAVELGRISAGSVQQYLPAPDDCGPIAGLLTGVVSSVSTSEKKKARLSDLTAKIHEKKTEESLKKDLEILEKFNQK